MSRVVLAMSGGVDSSVAAWLLREEGHEVTGVFMRHGAADDADARRVADLLDIPFHAVDFDRQFDRIIDYFVDEYTSGRTPNPCIVCNTRLKFGELFCYADSIAADYVATGHYVRLAGRDDPAPALLCGRDPDKDQSYALFGIQRSRLGRLKFPLGEYCKSRIRDIAQQLGLQVAQKRDSQDICFVPDQDHARLVRGRRTRDTSGEIVTTAGEVVGRHEGIEQFTIGQRKGLGITFSQRRFVIRIEPDTCRVVVGTREELARGELTAASVNWLIDPPKEPFRCEIKIRYRSRPVPATVMPLADDRFQARFDAPCYAVAPGQAAVCYDGEQVLGGGWIE